MDATHGLTIRATVRRRAEGGQPSWGTRGGPGHPAGAGPAGGGGGHQLGAPEDDRPGGGGRGGGPGLRRGTGDHHLRPWGEEAARRTFNPQLGGGGGISILGTSGIVEPMSAQALVETIALELRQAAAEGADRVVLTPGNYGADFLAESGLIPSDIRIVKCSNFIGEALTAPGGRGSGS